MKKALKAVLGVRAWMCLKILKQRLFPRPEQERELRARAAFYSRFVQSGEVCFDVGANFGNRVAPLLSLGAKVVAVEPQRPCYEYLRLKFGDKIQLVTKGLSSQEEIKEPHISPNSGVSSFSTEFIDATQKTARFGNSAYEATASVEMTTLDRLIEVYGVPRFIKIDVEGYELEVLKGLSHPVPMISFEYTVPEFTGRIMECVNAIRRGNPNVECNYSIGESMEFAWETWQPPEELERLILTDAFVQPADGFGDIYVRTKANDPV